jgi:hypothetical protein
MKSATQQTMIAAPALEKKSSCAGMTIKQRLKTTIEEIASASPRNNNN